MLGKYQLTINTNFDPTSIIHKIEQWSEENNLVEVKCPNGKRKYRYGSPFISNPIYIEIDLGSNPITITGWVQTLIPFFRWKLIKIEQQNIGTILDYRRKGGYFCFKLEEAIKH